MSLEDQIKELEDRIGDKPAIATEPNAKVVVSIKPKKEKKQKNDAKKL